jgi:hypothetical protein
MRLTLLTTACLALATPLHAQDPVTAEALLTTFTERCAAIAADPEAAIAAAVGADLGSGAVTTDKALLQLTTVIEVPGTSFASLFFNRVTLPADRGETCSLTASFDEPGTPVILPDLVEVLGARSADLLGGPTTRHGSDIFADGALAQSYIWSTGDSVNDPSLFVTQTSTYVLMAINRRAATN